MSHACHRFWKCDETLTFCSLLTRCTIPSADHAKNDIWTSKSAPSPSVFLHFWLRNALRATTACTFSTSQLPKAVRHWGVLYIFTSKRASRHNGVHFFRHLNFQKWSDAAVFCTFWLRNGLRATTACNFSSLIWPAGSAPAALASLLFDPPEPQITRKTQCFATFLPFRPSPSSFFWLFLFSDLLSSTLLFSLPLPSSAFHLSILSEVWLLNFLRLVVCILTCPAFISMFSSELTNFLVRICAVQVEHVFTLLDVDRSGKIELLRFDRRLKTWMFDVPQAIPEVSFWPSTSVLFV